jgi:hypothetical protein
LLGKPWFAFLALQEVTDALKSAQNVSVYTLSRADDFPHTGCSIDSGCGIAILNLQGPGLILRCGPLAITAHRDVTLLTDRARAFVL